MLERDVAWQAHFLKLQWCWSVTMCGRRRIWWGAVWLLAAGAIFAEVAMSVFAAGTIFGEILGDRRSKKCCVLPCEMRHRNGTSKLLQRAGARWRVHGRTRRRLSSDNVRVASTRLPFGWSNWRILRSNLEKSLRAHMLEGDSWCSAHWPGRFMCNTDQTRNDIFHGGDLVKLQWCWNETFCGRGWIWWSCNVTFRGKCIFGEVAMMLESCCSVKLQCNFPRQEHIWWSCNDAGVQLFKAGTLLMKLQCNFSWQVHIWWSCNDAGVLLFVAGTILSEVAM